MAYKDPERQQAYQSAYRIAHRGEHRVANNAWSATHQDERRLYGKMHREEHRAAVRAYTATHPAKCRAAVRAWQATHPEKRAEAYHRRRALKRGATVGPINLAAIRERDRMLCAICGRKVAEKDFSLDHTIPLALGGPHSQANLRVAHRHCNVKRGAGRLPVQIVLL